MRHAYFEFFGLVHAAIQLPEIHAIHFDADYGIVVLNKLPFNYPDDTELMNYFRKFMKIMANVAANLSSKELVPKQNGIRPIATLSKRLSVNDIKSNTSLKSILSQRSKPYCRSTKCWILDGDILEV